MQSENEQGTATGTNGRSSVEQLPATVRDAVARAIADSATIDEITELIRAHGGDCSRSAVGRYAKQVRDLVRRQHDIDRITEIWVRAFGERTDGRTDLVAIETLRTTALLSLTQLGDQGKPVTTEEVARLALALRRIEGADRLRAERKRVAAEAAERASRAGRKAGLSPNAVAVIRKAVEGQFRR